MRRILIALGLAGLVLLAACSAESESSPLERVVPTFSVESATSEPATSETEAVEAESEPVSNEVAAESQDEPEEISFCQALTSALAAAPLASSSEQAFLDYADALVAAAGLADPTNQAPLLTAAATYRAPADITADRVGELLPLMIPVYEYAGSVCGAVRPDVILHADGSMSWRGSVPNNPHPVAFMSRVVPEGELRTVPGHRGTQFLYSITPGGDAITHLNGVAGALPFDIDFETRQVAVDADTAGYDALGYVPSEWPSTTTALGTEFDGSVVVPGLSMTLSYGCQGVCRIKDWAQAANGVDGPHWILPRQSGEVFVNRPLANPQGHIVVLQSDVEDASGMVQVLVTRWHAQADRFFVCRATIPSSAPDLWLVFVEACTLSEPLWFR